ncbi:hypothetical protein AB0K51_12360 [Kitasatospora sp. NPDC049285]|uniref:hypothetical protein n=1 Tax=Kitasatospora sp. NPDC049285 TaxID=3157096 RepID=UPI00343DCFDC
MFLPQQQSTITGARVTLVDYPPALESTATADASGTATIVWDPPDVDYFYRIERATTFVTGNSSTNGAVLLYEGYINPIRIRDGSKSPAFDIADERSPITIHPTMPVIMQWTGLTPGSKCSASLQYTLWRTLTTLTPGSA